MMAFKNSIFILIQPSEMKGSLRVNFVKVKSLTASYSADKICYLDPIEKEILTYIFIYLTTECVGGFDGPID